MTAGKSQQQGRARCITGSTAAPYSSDGLNASSQRAASQRAAQALLTRAGEHNAATRPVALRGSSRTSISLINGEKSQSSKPCQERAARVLEESYALTERRSDRTRFTRVSGPEKKIGGVEIANYFFLLGYASLPVKTTRVSRTEDWQIKGRQRSDPAQAFLMKGLIFSKVTIQEQQCDQMKNSARDNRHTNPERSAEADRLLGHGELDAISASHLHLNDWPFGRSDDRTLLQTQIMMSGFFAFTLRFEGETLRRRV
ncbi:unnamed protein product [Leuciscus chuanchicus]